MFEECMVLIDQLLLCMAMRSGTMGRINTQQA